MNTTSRTGLARLRSNIFVLLAAYTDDNFAPLRLAQIKALSLHAVSIGSAIDLGDCCVVPWGTVHSRLKAPLGYRLMLSAARYVYGDQQVIADGPAMTSIMWPSSSSNASIMLSYDQSASNNVGLYLKSTAFCGQCCTLNSTASLFQIYVSSGIYYHADTVIVDMKAGTVQIVIDTSIPPETITGLALENTGFPQCVLANGVDLPSLPWHIT
jgi:hypothetical protein